MYELALEEVNTGKVRQGLWAKAISEAHGDEGKEKATYLRLRVQAMKGDVTIENAAFEESREEHAAGISQESSSKNTGHNGLCDICGDEIIVNYGDAYTARCKYCF